MKTQPLIPLSNLQEGDNAVILALKGGRELASRLASLGMPLNAQVHVLRNQGGLMMIQAGDTRIALGAGETQKILVRYVTEATCVADDTSEKRQLLVALVGQPNVGKSTVFNLLTGLSQHVGNWPGKTVEKKEGSHVCGDMEIRIIDLPGTYSLTAYSEEERISREFILSERPDVVVLLANAAALERSLYLLTEILLLGPPVIVAVNMTDVAEQQGIRVNTTALSRSLGLPVVAMAASRNQGVRDLVDTILALHEGNLPFSPQAPKVAADHEEIYLSIADLLSRHVPSENRNGLGGPIPWVATKIMEGDSEVLKTMQTTLPPDVWSKIQSTLTAHEDALHAVVGGRYDWIEAATRAAVSRFRMGQVVMTDRLDHILTRPIFGIPILLAVFALVFVLTYTIGFPLQEQMEHVVGRFSSWLSLQLATAPSWARGLVIDGIIGGVGAVLTFVPILALFFFVMAVLEEVGYMARAAFVLDRFMHLVGLHGKSAIPMCLGFGCNVPAVLGARIVESQRERLLTILLSPFVPCSARLAVLTLVSAAMFPKSAALVSWGLLTTNLLALGFVGLAVHRLAFKESAMPFIMELPLYHKPNMKVLTRVVWTRTLSFIRKAGTIILGVSAVIWLLAYFPDGSVETSYLALAGQWLQPLGVPLGLDWKMIVALLTSIVAKENAVATLGVLYGVGSEGLAQVLPTLISPASALSFLVIVMLFVPCVATVAVMRREMANWRWFVAAMLTMLTVSLGAGALVHFLAKLLGF